MKRTRYTKGFTLVELLIVIAIIAVLAGALFVVINPARLMAKANDSRRISEVVSVNKAFAAALADKKISILTSGAIVYNSCSNSTGVNGNDGWVRFTSVVAGGFKDYMGVLPKDPVNTAPRCYYFRASTTGWEINTTIQSQDSWKQAARDGGDDGTDSQCNVAVPPTGSTGVLNGTGCRYEVGTELTLI